jgi:membrane-associated phospholipid phosphatase
VSAWGIILLAVLSTGWLLTHSWEARVDPWDDGVVRWFASHRTSTLDQVAAACTFLGNIMVGFVLAAVVAGAASLWQRSLRPAFFEAISMAGVMGVYLSCTHLVPRDRPPVRILDPGLAPDHSFPSGHVATAVVVYCGTALLVSGAAPRLRRWTWLWVLVPGAVAVARLYQGAHHPTDVLTSLVFATAWVALVARVVLQRPPTVTRSRRLVGPEALAVRP